MFEELIFFLGRARLTKLTGRSLTIPLSDIVANVNRSLRGWANYFHFRNSSKMMSSQVSRGRAVANALDEASQG